MLLGTNLFIFVGAADHIIKSNQRSREDTLGNYWKNPERGDSGGTISILTTLRNTFLKTDHISAALWASSVHTTHMYMHQQHKRNTKADYDEGIS